MRALGIAALMLCILANPSRADQISDEIQHWAENQGYEYFRPVDISIAVGNILYRKEYIKGTKIQESGQLRYLCLPRDSTDRVALEKSSVEYNWKRDSQIFSKSLKKDEIESAVLYDGQYDRITSGYIYINAAVESLGQKNSAAQVKSALGKNCSFLWNNNAKSLNTLFVNAVAHFSTTYLIFLSQITSVQELENIKEILESRNPSANIEIRENNSISLTKFDSRISVDMTIYGNDEGS
jgi:hypothetical protein